MIGLPDGQPLTARVRALGIGTIDSGVPICSPPDADLLDATDTRSGGEFSVQISQTLPFYETTVCLDGFVPAHQRALNNARDGEPVVPVPVALWPEDTSAAESPAFEALVTRVATSALNELSYLRSVDPSAFDAAMERRAGALSDYNGDAFWGLVLLVRDWGGEE